MLDPICPLSMNLSADQSTRDIISRNVKSAYNELFLASVALDNYDQFYREWNNFEGPVERALVAQMTLAGRSFVFSLVLAQNFILISGKNHAECKRAADLAEADINSACPDLRLLRNTLAHWDERSQPAEQKFDPNKSHFVSGVGGDGIGMRGKDGRYQSVRVDASTLNAVLDALRRFVCELPTA